MLRHTNLLESRQRPSGVQTALTRLQPQLAGHGLRRHHPPIGPELPRSPSRGVLSHDGVSPATRYRHRSASDPGSARAPTGRWGRCCSWCCACVLPSS